MPVTPWIADAIDQAVRRTRGIAAAVDDFPHITHQGAWQCTADGVWTGGFWAGILWLASGRDGGEDLLGSARHYTDRLLSRSHDSHNHDLGFMFYPSAVKAWEVTGDTRYHQAAVEAGVSLAGQFNPDAGYIAGWGFFGKQDWSGSVLIDTLMNLPIIVWAVQQGADEAFMEVVRRHLATSLRHHLRSDGSVYHVYRFDPANGAPLGGDTYQGLHAQSWWSRGQAWAITGLAILATMTREAALLEASERVASFFVERLPATDIPPWDFAAEGPEQPRDSSAAAIASYGFLKLHRLTGKAQHLGTATRLLKALATSCGNRTDDGGLLLHATADLPHDLGIDGSTMYGDFYYLKALIALEAVLAAA